MVPQYDLHQQEGYLALMRKKETKANSSEKATSETKHAGDGEKSQEVKKESSNTEEKAGVLPDRDLRKNLGCG